MTPETAAHLTALNRRFYEQFASEFSGTRQGTPPGMERLLATVPPEASILDLGCGNGRAAVFLAQHGHTGRYTGLEASPGLLDEARRRLQTNTQAEFILADLSHPGWEVDLPNAHFDIGLAFAVLHHIPSRDLRLNFTLTMHDHLLPNGRFLLSNWQFLNSPRLRARIQPWEAAGLRAADVDEGDALLDWRQGGHGLRYVHHFTEASLTELAGESGFRVIDSFLSDGEGGKLGLYQVWEYN